MVLAPGQWKLNPLGEALCLEQILVASFTRPDLLFLFCLLLWATSLTSISPPIHLGSSVGSLF